MNKSELAKEVARRAGLTQVAAAAAVTATFAVIEDALARGEDVTYKGFGTFQRRYRKGHRKVDPRNHEEVNVPAKHVPFLKAGKSLKERVS